MAHFIKADGQPADVCGYGEAAYFGGFHFQHIAARDEAERLARDRRAMGARYGMTGRRARDKAATA